MNANDNQVKVEPARDRPAMLSILDKIGNAVRCTPKKRAYSAEDPSISPKRPREEAPDEVATLHSESDILRQQHALISGAVHDLMRRNEEMETHVINARNEYRELLPVVDGLERTYLQQQRALQKSARNRWWGSMDTKLKEALESLASAHAVVEERAQRRQEQWEQRDRLQKRAMELEETLVKVTKLLSEVGISIPALIE